jgi:hypothetical protein|tara:strand:+ start:110 stop:514 length:405 start_codon:yes stop_codon:yes gene_type:complete
MHYIHNREELVTHITDRVAEIRESFPDVQSFPDLHHELFNTDYYIVGTYQAKQWLGDYAFDAIREIKDYEEANFGEVITDLSDPEKVVNMYTYIAGEQLIEEMDFVTVEAIRPEEFFIDAADFNAMLLDAAKGS